MIVGSRQGGRLILTSLRVWTLVLAALIFGQFTSVSHAHDAHDEAPVACDVCISALSEDDEDTVELDDEPQPFNLNLDVIPSALTLEDEASAPVFSAARRTFVLPDTRRTQPRQTRAPPI